MSNTNNNLQTQTSNALHNGIMEIGGKDHPPMLATGHYVQWKFQIKRYIDTKPNNELIYYCLHNPPYKFKWAERTILVLKDSLKTTTESQELKTGSYHKLYHILKQYKNKVNEIRSERLACTANLLALIAQQQPVYHPQNHPTHYIKNPSTIPQQATTEKIYKPTNHNLRTSSNTSRANQDNTLKLNRGTGYDNQRVVNVAGARENVGTQVVHLFRIQCYNYKEYGHVAKECQKPKRAKDAAYHKEKMILYQKLEEHYMYIAQIHRVTLDVENNSGPIFDAEPLQKVQNDGDNYNVFANDREYPEKPEFINNTYPDEQGDNNITTDSIDMSNNRGEADQDKDEDLARERGDDSGGEMMVEAGGVVEMMV
nr:hypothetical protein [Tanacetum cinerariifolium]